MKAAKFSTPSFTVAVAVICGIAFALSIGTCRAAVLTIDTFDDPFSLETDRSANRHASRGSMWAGHRTTTVYTERRSTTVRAGIAAGSSLLVFDTGAGPAGPLPHQGSLGLLYSSNSIPSNLLNLLDATGFELEILSLTGAGELHIGINQTGFGTSSTFIPIAGPGSFFFPIDSVDRPNISLDSVGIVHLVISGTTPDFSMSLGSFRVVPEPGTPILGLFALSFFLRLRRRPPPQPPTSDL